MGWNMNELVKIVIDFLKNNYDGVIAGIIATAICCFVAKIWKNVKKTPQSINDLLNNIDYNNLNWKDELDKALQVKQTMKSNFPEYKNYLLIQYGSSVSTDSTLPSDYDFIVLMLGYPENEIRYMHNKGTISDISDGENKYHVDIVFRDYLSFLFAASAGMPYENSVIAGGQLIKGPEGYFQWLRNITINNLFDRDFLVRRYRDKISIEKQEFQKCMDEHKKYGHDKYYVIRSGYYYITSILQFNRIIKSEKVMVQNEIVQLSKVRNFYEDIDNEEIQEKYIQLVENLKRNRQYDLIEIDDIKKILSYVKMSEEEKC